MELLEWSAIRVAEIRERESWRLERKKKISGVKGEKKKMKKNNNNNNRRFPNGVSDYRPNWSFFKTFGCI